MVTGLKRDTRMARSLASARHIMLYLACMRVIFLIETPQIVGSASATKAPGSAAEGQATGIKEEECNFPAFTMTT